MSIKTFSLNTKDALIQNSSLGNLLKWRVVQPNKKDIFVKTSSYVNAIDRWAFESYSELIVCRLFKELGINNVVMYYPCKIIINNKVETFGCYSYSFLKENETYISISHLLKHNLIKLNTTSGQNLYKSCIDEVHRVSNIKYKKELDKIIELDYLTLNQDRHLGNLGFIYSNTTGKISIAPIFDNGNSLFGVKFLDDIDKYDISLDNYMVSRPFLHRHRDQIKLIQTGAINIFSVPKTLHYIQDLSKYCLSENRSKFIKSMIETRLNNIRTGNYI